LYNLTLVDIKNLLIPQTGEREKRKMWV